MTVKVLHGDCRSILPTIPSGWVNCCITSPPYFGLRDYGHPDQIGLEKSPDEYVATLVAVFEEVRRILRDDGSLWLNLGDCYAGSMKGGQSSEKRSKHWEPKYSQMASSSNVGLADKQLIGIPWRVAFALQAAGWWLREDIVWHKKNPMPESVEDRCTRAHEFIFHLTKSAHYFHDADAIAEPAIYFGLKGQDASGFKDAALFNGKRKRKSDKQRGHGVRHAGFNDRWDQMTTAEQCSGKRNKRSVWTVATQPFKEAHFATFPPELIEPCVLAGCPKGGVILDPFGGSGTTGLVARNHERDAILIELSEDFARMADVRVHGSLFAGATDGN